MASQGAEHESQVQAWIKAYEELPADRRDKLKLWFATQRLIVENAGIPLLAWCAHLEWALNNPLDYTFILDFPAKAQVAKARDASQRGDETSKARSLIGSGTAKTPLEGRAASAPGIQEKAKSDRGVDHELLARFLKERMKPGSK